MVKSKVLSSVDVERRYNIFYIVIHNLTLDFLKYGMKSVKINKYAHIRDSSNDQLET